MGGVAIIVALALGLLGGIWLNSRKLVGELSRLVSALKIAGASSYPGAYDPHVGSSELFREIVAKCDGGISATDDEVIRVMCSEAVASLPFAACDPQNALEACSSQVATGDGFSRVVVVTVKGKRCDNGHYQGPTLAGIFVEKNLVLDFGLRTAQFFNTADR